LILAKLCKAGLQLREQIDDAFPDRSRVSPEGWLADRLGLTSEELATLLS